LYIGYKESWVNELDVSDDLILDHVNYVEFGSYKKTYETKKEINNLLVQVLYTFLLISKTELSNYLTKVEGWCIILGN